MKTGLNIGLKGVGLLVVGLVCASCSVLKSPYYAGELGTISEKDLASETVWMQGDDVYFVKRVDSNTVVAATLDWDEKAGGYQIRSFPLVLSTIGDHMFLNVKDGEYYSIFRVAGSDDDDTFLLFTIDSDKIKQDISDEKIKAREDGEDIVMECTKEEQDAYILENINSIFDMGSGSLVRKISEDQESKPCNTENIGTEEK